MGSLGTLTFSGVSHLHAVTSRTSGETASYDAAGDLTCRAPTSATTCAGVSLTGAQLAYDAERRLTHWQNAPTNPTSQAWYLYDGSGQRVEQYVSGGSGNHTYYLPGGVEEVTPSGSLIKYYSAGGMTIGLNTTRDASGISYLASDGLGSVSEALSQSGTATGAVLYSPYGGVRYTSGTMPTAKGFTGQYSDGASSGLDYYGARYYDPSLGQFTSADTVADGLDRFAYVHDDPETGTDPTGHIDSGDLYNLYLIVSLALSIFTNTGEPPIPYLDTGVSAPTVEAQAPLTPDENLWLIFIQEDTPPAFYGGNQDDGTFASPGTPSSTDPANPANWGADITGRTLMPPEPGDSGPSLPELSPKWSNNARTSHAASQGSPNSEANSDAQGNTTAYRNQAEMQRQSRETAAEDQWYDDPDVEPIIPSEPVASADVDPNTPDNWWDDLGNYFFESTDPEENPIGSFLEDLGDDGE